MQLDIFEHSRDLMLRNDVLGALEQRDAAAARSAWRKLLAEYPHDATLPALEQLVLALERSDSAPFADHAAAAEAQRAMRDDLEPAALQLWGEQAGSAWLAALWCQLGRRAARLPYRAEMADEHAAMMFLKGRDFAAAAEAVAQIESWRRIPAPLAWMTEARMRLHGLDASWGLLAELAWLAPGRLDALTRRLADPVLGKLRRQFDAEFDADFDAQFDDQFDADKGNTGLAWFPAWVLTEKPALAGLLGGAAAGLQSAPERAMRLLLDLLHLERQGRQRELIAQRKRLRDLQPALYACYMKSR
jgi:hypothetical protein